MGEAELLDYIKIGTDDRIYAIAQLLRLNTSVDSIAAATLIDKFFIRKLRNIVEEENEVKSNCGNIKVLREAKKMGFSDKVIASFWNMPEIDIFNLPKKTAFFLYTK